MADNPYINKVEANNQTLIDLTSDTAEAADVLEGRTLHLASGAPATGTYRPSDEIEARLEATVGHSCKNLLEITAETKTTNGVTFTSDIVNGTITAEGQTTNTSEGSQYNFQGDGLRVINNIESGMLMSLEVESTPTITSGAYLAIGYYNSQQNYISEQRCIISVGELALSIPSNAAYYRLFVRKTRTAGGTTVVYKPMLRDGSISDDTFEPYVQPTDERIVALEARVEALEAALNR